MVKVNNKAMQKQKREVIEAEEFDSESVSEQLESDTDEENESKAGESEGEESGVQSEDEGEEGLALAASSTESDEDDDDDDDEEANDVDEEEVAEDAEEVSGDDDEEQDVDEVDKEVSEDEDDEEEGSDDDEKENDEDDDEENDDDEKEADEDHGKVNENNKKEADEDVDNPKKKDYRLPADKVEQIRQQMTESFEKRKGLQLYIRLPGRLPESEEEFQTKIKSLSDLIINAHKPRQKYARFCLADFASKEDRDKVFLQLSDVSQDTDLVVSLPDFESEGAIERMVERKVKQIEEKHSKLLLRKESLKTHKSYTSVLRVFNIPKSASMAQITDLFPNAVDIQMKPSFGKYQGFCTATITFPSTNDASANQKRKLTLGGNELMIWFVDDKKNRFGKFNKKPWAMGGPRREFKNGHKKDYVATEEQSEERLNNADDKNDEVAQDKQRKPLLGKKRLISGDEKDETPKEKQQKPSVGKKLLSNGDQKDEVPKEKKQKPIAGKKRSSDGNEVEKPQKPIIGKKQLNGGDGEKQMPAKKIKLTQEKETIAKSPQKKQKQSQNGNAKEVKVKQDQPEAARANGKPHQKKGGEALKQKLPAKNPFNKNQQAQKLPIKKAKAGKAK